MLTRRSVRTHRAATTATVNEDTLETARHVSPLVRTGGVASTGRVIDLTNSTCRYEEAGHHSHVT